MVDLGISGQRISELGADYSVVLNTNGSYEIRIEVDFAIGLPDGSGHAISLEELDANKTLLNGLVSLRVASSQAADSGSLKLTFVDGSFVQVEPHESYEAWTIAGPNGRKVVCMPGGELAVWSAEKS